MKSDQKTLALSAAEVWRDKFIALASAKPGATALDLLGPRYPDPRNKNLAPGTGAFDFDRFQGWGLWLATGVSA